MAKYFLPFICLCLLAFAGCGDNGAETPKKAEEQPLVAAAGEEVPPQGADDSDEGAARENPAGQSPERADKTEAAVDEGPVAMVNGTPVERNMFESQVARSMAEQMRFGSADLDDPETRDEAYLALRFMVLNNMVSLELACQEALRLGYAPPEEDLEAAVGEIKKGYEQQPEAFNELLSSYGETENDLREQLGKTMALKKWQDDNFLAQITVAPEEAKAFYDQNQNLLRRGPTARVSQIFLPVALLAQPHEKEKIKTRAEFIGQLLKAGEDFNYLASEMSEDQETVEQLGDLGWVEKGQSLAMVDEAIFSLKPGEVSELVESPLGYYYFKVFEVREPGVAPFNEVRSTIVEYLSGQKLEMVLRDKMIELYEKADVQILDAALKRVYDDFMAESEPAPGPDGDDSSE